MSVCLKKQLHLWPQDRAEESLRCPYHWAEDIVNPRLEFVSEPLACGRSGRCPACSDWLFTPSLPGLSEIVGMFPSSLLCSSLPPFYKSSALSDTCLLFYHSSWTPQPLVKPRPPIILLILLPTYSLSSTHTLLLITWNSSCPPA